jgi:hypothetical protein
MAYPRGRSRERLWPWWSTRICTRGTWGGTATNGGKRPENSGINRTCGFADFAERAVAAGVDRDAILGGTARACYGLDSA